MMRQRIQRGYILLMTLVLLALAAVAMSGICLKSLGHMTESRIIQDNLQRRWGMISCQNTLGGKTEEILKKAQQDGPIHMISQSLTLGGQTFHLVFSDEQAKANINTLFSQKGRSDTTAALRSLLREADSQLTVRLRPAPDKGEPDFSSFGQVFLEDLPQNLVVYDHPQASPTADLTCWGSGRLNALRASPAALKMVCGSILGDAGVDRLVYLRRNHPSLALEQLLKQLDLSRQRQQLAALLTDRSSCHALWMICQDKSRRWYDLIVTDQTDPHKPRVYHFEW